MPELPVETIIRALQVNRASIEIDIRRKDILRLQEYEVEELHGRTIKTSAAVENSGFEPGRDLNLIFIWA